MQKVKEEYTGWRDEAISRRHRLWGWDCPAVDIDFLMVEYDHGIAKALVEYKRENARVIQPNHPTYRALKNLSDKANIPFFVTRYSEDLSNYHVECFNDLAYKKLPTPRDMSEKTYVKFLYFLRGYKDVPQEVLTAIKQGKLQQPTLF